MNSSTTSFKDFEKYINERRAENIKNGLCPAWRSYIHKKGYLGYNGLYYWDNPREFFKKTFFYVKGTLRTWVQRAARGYADSDVWNFDSYLASVISGGLAHLKATQHGHPASLSPEEWDEILQSLVDGFTSYGNERMDSFGPPTDEQVEEWYMLINTFGRWFEAFWD